MFLQQIRHDLLVKARLSLPEVDALLAHPELSIDAAAPTPTQANLRGILRQSLEAASLRAAIGTFERDLNRPAGIAEAAATPQAEQLDTNDALSDPASDGLVDPPSGGSGD